MLVSKVFHNTLVMFFCQFVRELMEWGLGFLKEL